MIFNFLQVLFKQFSLNPAEFIRNLRAYRLFLKDLERLKVQQQGKTDFPISKWYPILHERFVDSGILSGHYFHQDLLVAKRIFNNQPERHVDIGSRTDGFVAHVASYRPIEVFDIRKLDSKIDNIVFVQADFTESNEKLINYTDSLSCLHAIEHFGLGRYGDKVDANGHLKGLANMYTILKKGGKFYFATPIGPQRIEFNAHRVFSINYLLNLFQDKYTIDNFSYVDDKGDLHENQKLTPDKIDTSFGCQYGCGIFEMTKI